MKSLIMSLIFIIVSSPALAQAEEVLSLAQWRTQQVINAENQAVRISNSITRIKATTGKLSKIRSLESDLRVALQNADLAGQLTVEDYFNIYLSRFSDSDSALVRAAKSMSEEEIASLLKLLLKSKSTAANLTGSQTSSLSYL